MGRKFKRWIITDAGMREEVAHWLLEERNVWGTRAKLWKENIISTLVKKVNYMKEYCGIW